MKVYIVGNELVKEDSFPIKFLPKLRKTFPTITFEEADPNENFVPDDGSIIIDTVQGIDKVTWFDSLDAFEVTKSVSPHDYDLGLHLRLLKKLKKLESVRILGIPRGASPEKILTVLRHMLSM